jgi:hypothetical protein
MHKTTTITITTLRNATTVVMVHNPAGDAQEDAEELAAEMVEAVDGDVDQVECPVEGGTAHTVTFRLYPSRLTDRLRMIEAALSLTWRSMATMTLTHETK